MPTIKIDLRVSSNASSEEIIDKLIKLARDLEWLLNGNLDEKNVKTMRFQSGNVTGDIAFQGNVTISSGTALGTVNMNDSTSTTVEGIRSDLNQLLTILRNYKILDS